MMLLPATATATATEYYRSDQGIFMKRKQIKVIQKLDEVGPVDNTPSTAETPPIGKIHPFSKIAVTLELVMRLRCP